MSMRRVKSLHSIILHDHLWRIQISIVQIQIRVETLPGTYIIVSAVVVGRHTDARNAHGERGESSESTRLQSPSHGERRCDQ